MYTSLFWGAVSTLLCVIAGFSNAIRQYELRMPTLVQAHRYATVVRYLLDSIREILTLTLDIIQPHLILAT